MALETPITLVGNLVDDPVLRHTAGGVAVASFRVASTSRTFDRPSGQWVDGHTVYLTCSAWRQQALNVAATCRRGTRVVVHGRLRQRAWTDEQGRRRTVVDVDADEVAASLRFASGTLTKTGGEQHRQPPADPPTDGSWASRMNDPSPAPDWAAAPPLEGAPAAVAGPVRGASDGPRGDVWSPPGYDAGEWSAYPPLEPGDEPPF